MKRVKSSELASIDETFAYTDQGLVRKSNPDRLVGTILSNGYVRVYHNGRPYTAHYLVWYLAKREWPHGYIEHLDGNHTNNAIDNLRYTSYNKAKYKASINICGRTLVLGQYNTRAEATAARTKALHDVYHDVGELLKAL